MWPRRLTRSLLCLSLSLRLSLLFFLLCRSTVANHTGRIKLVFTPTICKLTCSGGRCHNTCEKGNTTTIISENGRATDTLTAPNFRVGESPGALWDTGRILLAFTVTVKRKKSFLITLIIFRKRTRT